MSFAVYATYEQMHGRKSTVEELTRLLQRFSRESVLYGCAVSGVLLKLWERGGWDRTNYDVMIGDAFEFIRGDWYKLAARLDEPELVFHRRQLLFLMKLAIEHCPATGEDLLKTGRGLFGTMLLMANDHFHYGLYPNPSGSEADSFDKISRVAAEFVPVNEYSGFRIENKLTRAHLMMTRYTNQLRGHPDFIDISAEYEKATGISLIDYEAMSFGLFVRCTVNITLEALRANAWVAAVRPENFNQTAIPSAIVQAFLGESSGTPTELLASITASRKAKRDFGANDFTVFRKKPLITEAYGSLPSDIVFITEKFETGPYWRVNDIDSETGDKLRRFWGAVFEAYVNDVITVAARGAEARFIPDPHLISNPNIQLCDGLLIEGDALVIMEYKASMFTARAKYSGDHVLLRNEIEAKLVRDSAEKRKKGVEQLGDAVTLLFSDPNLKIVKGLDVSGIKRVYPLLITLDDLGSSLLISKLLNFSFTKLLNKATTRGAADIRPVFCTDIEGLEVVLPYLGVRPLNGFLQHWLDSDAELLGTLLARLPEGLPRRRNEFLDKEWKTLNEEISSRLFPAEHAAQTMVQTSEVKE
jgi:hypothetical protein